MNEEQYRLLKALPVDKSYLSHEQLNDIMGGDVDYDTLTSAYSICWSAAYIEGYIPKPGLRVTDEGLKAIKDYEFKKERGAEIDELNFKKLKFDVKNSERIFKTYWYTFIMSAVAFIISIILLILRIIEHKV